MSSGVAGFDRHAFATDLSRVLSVDGDHVFVVDVDTTTHVVTARIFDTSASVRTLDEIQSALAEMGPAGLSYRLDNAYDIQAMNFVQSPSPPPSPPRPPSPPPGPRVETSSASDDDGEGLSGVRVSSNDEDAVAVQAIQPFYTTAGAIAGFCIVGVCVLIMGALCCRVWILNAREKTVGDDDDDDVHEGLTAAEGDAAHSAAAVRPTVDAPAALDEMGEDEAMDETTATKPAFQLDLKKAWRPPTPAKGCLRSDKASAPSGGVTFAAASPPGATTDRGSCRASRLSFDGLETERSVGLPTERSSEVLHTTRMVAGGGQRVEFGEPEPRAGSAPSMRSDGRRSRASSTSTVAETPRPDTECLARFSPRLRAAPGPAGARAGARGDDTEEDSDPNAWGTGSTDDDDDADDDGQYVGNNYSPRVGARRTWAPQTRRPKKPIARAAPLRAAPLPTDASDDGSPSSAREASPFTA